MPQQIPIQNLYYLLCYAWDVPDLQRKVKVDGALCHSPQNLLAMVLVAACERILRRGLTHEYQFEEQEVEGIRGKLNVADTLKSGKYRQGRTVCMVDELSQDVPINQIIYSTFKRLLRLPSLDKTVQDKVRNVLRRFPRLREIPVTPQTFERVKIHRNNRSYTLVLHVCKLIHQSTLPKQGTEGRYEFIDFTRDEFKMNILFERFLMNFCKLHCREEFPEIGRSNIDFHLSSYGMVFTQDNEQALRLLPTMQTDVTLYNPSTGRKTILDAKYYEQMLTSRFSQQGKIRREHLSQILSYVVSQEKNTDPHTHGTDGILVYPTVTEDYDVAYRYRNTAHTIRVSTINLNQDWPLIEARLKDIVERKIEIES